MTEQIDWREKSPTTSGLLVGRSEVLRSLIHYLRAQSQGHHTIDRVERTAWKEEELDDRPWERAIVNKKNIGIVSKSTLRKNLPDGVERIIMSFSGRIDTMLN